MALRSSSERWGLVTRLLHWGIAIAVLGMIGAGLWAASIKVTTGADELEYYSIIDVHKSFGVLVIALAAFRVVWRIAEATPALPDGMPVLEKLAARTAQLLLYAALFFMPVTGFLWASAYGEPVRVFGLRLPGIVHVRDGDATLAHHVHILAAFFLIAVIGAHVAGALKNHVIDRNDVLTNMLGLRRKPAAAPRSPA
jgi:cytochrome b561